VIVNCSRGCFLSGVLRWSFDASACCCFSIFVIFYILVVFLICALFVGLISNVSFEGCAGRAERDVAC